MDELPNQIRHLIRRSEFSPWTADKSSAQLGSSANQSKVESEPSFPDLNSPLPRAAIPYLSEAWYCCAEPNEDQLAHV